MALGGFATANSQLTKSQPHFRNCQIRNLYKFATDNFATANSQLQQKYNFSTPKDIYYMHDIIENPQFSYLKFPNLPLENYANFVHFEIRTYYNPAAALFLCSILLSYYNMFPFPAKYVTSQRGKLQLRDTLLHTYNATKTTADGSKTIYTCVERQKEAKCKSTATVKNSSQMVISITDHNHFVNAGKLVAKMKTKQAIENAVQNPDVKPRNVILNLAQDLDRAGPSVVSNMDNKSTITRRIRYNRRIHFLLPPFFLKFFLCF